MLKTEQFTQQDYRFDNIECFTQLFENWQLETYPLEAKVFSGWVSRLDIGSLSISQIAVNCKAEFVGTTPDNTLLFLIPLNNAEHKVGYYFDHAIPMQQNCLLGLNSSQPLNLVSTSSDIEFVVLQLKEDYFYKIASRLGFCLDRDFLNHYVMGFDKEHIDAYRKYLNQIIYLLKNPPENLDSTVDIINLQDDIVSRLIGMMQTAVVSKTPRPLRRADIVQIARAYMHAQIQQPLTLAEVSQAINVSRRSLIYGFQDVYGMGPMTYLKYQRLNRVRNELRAQRGSHKTVADIANVCGFWSLGHFARNYRLMFGESPSETLKK
jgi:AraC family ethanolamine operon transcriptional activator